MSWCSKWIHGSEWPEGVEVTLGHDGNVRRYVPESENANLREESSKYHDLYVHAITDAEVWHLQWSAEHQENAKLRSELESVGTAAYLYGRGDIQAENAKLREELADVSKCETCEAMLDCDECLRADDSQKERKRIAFENAKLRELCTDFMAMLTLAGLEGLRVEATIGGVTKTYDASELCDKVEELFDEVC